MAGAREKLQEYLELHINKRISTDIDLFPHHGTFGVAAIAHKGDEVMYVNAGANPFNNEPITADTVGFMYSGTKIITSILTMMLWEQGVIKLDDPISQYLDAGNDPSGDGPISYKVVRPVKKTEDGKYPATFQDDESGIVYSVEQFEWEGETLAVALVDANREPTIRDLLSSSSGLRLNGLWKPEIRKMSKVDEFAHYFYIDTHLSDAIAKRDVDTAKTVSGYFGHNLQVGLLTGQPGEAFRYGLDYDILGMVCEVAHKSHTGEFKRLQNIMKEMIWEPLGMNSTFFFLENGDPRQSDIQQRLAPIIETDGESDIGYKLSKIPLPGGIEVEQTQAMLFMGGCIGPFAESGGGGDIVDAQLGLKSSCRDMDIVINMLRESGYSKVNKRRFLKASTVRYMQSSIQSNTNHSEYGRGQEISYLIENTEGFGLGGSLPGHLDMKDAPNPIRHLATKMSQFNRHDELVPHDAFMWQGVFGNYWLVSHEDNFSYSTFSFSLAHSGKYIFRSKPVDMLLKMSH